MTAGITFFLNSGFPFLTVAMTISPTPPAGRRLRRAPIPLTEMMYKLRAPELSQQFMTAPLSFCQYWRSWGLFLHPPIAVFNHRSSRRIDFDCRVECLSDLIERTLGDRGSSSVCHLGHHDCCSTISPFVPPPSKYPPSSEYLLSEPYLGHSSRRKCRKSPKILIWSVGAHVRKLGHFVGGLLNW